VLTYFGQVFAFYLRHPVKLFRPSTLDYTVPLPLAQKLTKFAAKLRNPAIRAGTAPLYKTLTPWILASTIKHHGWSFVGNNVLPPFLANMTIGIVLYTSFMASLPVCTGIKEPDNVYPPPPFRGVFAAGAIAGAAQTLVSTPLMTLEAHFKSSSSAAQSLWTWTYSTIRQLGLRSTYTTLRLNLLKESVSYGLFFGVFEYVKQQGYYHFLDFYYGSHTPIQPGVILPPNSKKPHWALSPLFVLLAGSSASIAHSLVSYPLTKIQRAKFKIRTSYRAFLASPSYSGSYVPTTWQVLKRGGLYKGFGMNALRMIPGSSVALIIFEGVRRRFAPEGEGVWGGDVVVPSHKGIDI